MAHSINETLEAPQEILSSPNERLLSVEYKAMPGYRIDSYELARLSVNSASGETVRIAADGKTIKLEVKLRSGPRRDQRAWYKASLLTIQEPSK